MAYTTIDDPSVYFHTQLYTGDAQSSKVITNDANAGDFKPDWLWIKERSSTSSHLLFDSTRGTNKKLTSNSTDSEETFAYLSSYDTDGFTIGTSDGAINDTQTYVAWQWKANGGTTSSNSDGTITSTVQANTTAGFSIITYTGNFDTMTIGHGLSQAPEALIIKNRESNSTSWVIYHKDLNFPTDDLAYFNTNAANQHDPTFNNTRPSSSVITNGAYSFNNKNGEGHVCYAFHSVKGYSKFGSYTGNGNADGTFVYTGFKPAWVMIHRTDSSGENWQMFDNKRDGFNNGSSSNKMLKANVSETEDSNSTGFLDLLSNGFKIRESAARHNASGGTYIYMAFAEHPFVSSKGVPVTAR